MFKNSFSYMLNDNKFLNKYLITFIFVSLFLFCDGILKSNCYTFNNILNIVLLSIIVFFVHTIIIGYRITNISALNIENNVQPLPLLNLQRDFLTGFKFQLSIFVFGLLATYFIGGFGFFAALSAFIYNDFVCHTLLFLMFASVLLYIIYNLFFGLGFINLYAKQPSYVIFFKIKLLFSLIKNTPKKYILSLLFNAITILLLWLFNLIINNSNTIIFMLTVIISSVIMTYLFFVNNYVIANCINVDKNTSSS